jgi:hypothetical protein
MGTHCGSRERSNPDDAREEVIPTGSKAVREEEDGIGSGSQGSTDFFARTVFITYEHGFFDVPRRAHHHAPLAELLVEIYSLRPLVKFRKANDMSQISNFAPEF